MNKNKIATIAEDILNQMIGNKDWEGPEGKCFCKALGRNVSPKTDNYNEIREICPECQNLFINDKRQVDYTYMDSWTV
jgi:hypothetical protein